MQACNENILSFILFEVFLLSQTALNNFIMGMSRWKPMYTRIYIKKVRYKEHICKRSVSSCSEWSLGAANKAVQIFQHGRQTCANCRHLIQWDVLSQLHTGQFLSAVVLLTLLVFVFGVKSLQQGSHDVPWDLLVLVYERLDCLLHLYSKKWSQQHNI